MGRLDPSFQGTVIKGMPRLFGEGCVRALVGGASRMLCPAYAGCKMCVLETQFRRMAWVLVDLRNIN